VGLSGSVSCWHCHQQLATARLHLLPFTARTANFWCLRHLNPLKLEASLHHGPSRSNPAPSTHHPLQHIATNNTSRTRWILLETGKLLQGTTIFGFICLVLFRNIAVHFESLSRKSHSAYSHILHFQTFLLLSHLSNHLKLHLFTCSHFFQRSNDETYFWSCKFLSSSSSHRLPKMC
jgi:hypothetical protein